MGIKIDADNWTPGRGWLIGLTKLAYRAAVVGLVAGAIEFLAFPIVYVLPAHFAIMGVLFLIMAAVGWPMGSLQARKIIEDSGLAGHTLALPAVALLMAAHIGVYHAVLALRGDGGFVLLTIAGGMGVWSMAAAVKKLLTES